MSYYNCVDISEWNGIVDWEQAKNDSVQYAFIRCGLGKYYLNYSDPDKRADMQAKWEETNGEDKCFQPNMDGALDAGIKVGAYFYSYARNAQEAEDEAIQCVNEIAKYKDALSALLNNPFGQYHSEAAFRSHSLILSSLSSPSQLASYDVPSGLPVYFADYRTLISLNRSNGGATYLSEGEIILKWTATDAPTDYHGILADDPVNLSTWKLGRSRIKAQGFCLYLAALLLLV